MNKSQSELRGAFKVKMLKRLEVECFGCDKCEIGNVTELFDPHVFSNMNFKAKVMVIGQNPGMNEVKAKRPFVGVSGKIFDNALEKSGLSRKDFYICNSIRCMTPTNRKPSHAELANCRYFIEREIDAIKPLLVVTLGEFGLRTFCRMKGVLALHGEVLYSDEFNVNVFPLIHPSPLNLNRGGKKKIFEDDMKKLKNLMLDF